jgi:hypothetical protein
MYQVLVGLIVFGFEFLGLIVVVFFHGPSLCNDVKTFLNVYEYKMR